MLTYVFWPLFCAAMALGQGLLLPTLRTVPPGSDEAARNNRALHGVLVLAYLLPLLLVPATWPEALGSRLLFFDPCINAGSDKPLFYVGQTAAMDKLLQRVALGLSWPAERVRGGLWLLALGAVVAYLIIAH